MAKDRDRRYQTPEHLVRELLGIAGLVGLAPASVAGGRVARGTGIDPRGSRTWCGWSRSSGFVMVVMGLAWWGREPSPAVNSSPRSSGPRVSELNVVAGPAAAGSSPSLGRRRCPARAGQPRAGLSS